MSKNKLELTWYGKDEQLRIEPRILIEDPDKSNLENGSSDNMLIHGDNLLALKALEQEYAGRIKCIYIDPPYNIRVVNPHYDDNLQRSEWLSLMKARIDLLWKLLADDGLLAIQIDDENFPFLYLMLIEICGLDSIKPICVKMSEPTGVKMASVNQARGLAKLKEFVILAKRGG